MAEVKKINVGPALTVPLALARRGGQIVTDQFQKHSVSEKVTSLKEHPTVDKMLKKRDVAGTVFGLVLLFHGAQFRNLFLCTQVIYTFCYDRVKGSVLSLYSSGKVAFEKMNEDEGDESKADAKAEAKPESNKHAAKRNSKAKAEDSKGVDQKNEEDAAVAKKVLKVMDSDKVTGVFFELVVSAIACHMVMEGGLATHAIIAHALVKATKEKIVNFLDFSEHNDLEVWTNLLLSFVLYSFFGGMSLVAPSMAFALNVALVGAQLVSEHGLRVVEGMGKIPGGETAEAFSASVKGLALLGGLVAFGAVWQFWALMAESGMGWYFKVLYLPAYVAENVVSVF